jgi:cytochrome P450
MRQVKAMLLRLLGGDLEALANDALGEFCRRSRQGAVVPLAIGLKRAHLVSAPAIVRHVLLDNIANYDKVTPAFDAVRIVLGNGMLTSAGAFWKRQRRIAQPAFHGESVKRFGPILSRMAAETADTWDDAARAGATVDACTDMMKVTLRAVAETLFGDDRGDSAAEINRVFPTILSCLASRVASPVRPPLWLPTANNRRLRPALAALDRVVERRIVSRSRPCSG